MGKLLAYADRWSVSAKETIRFFVSSEGVSHYDAEIVRLKQPEVGPQATRFHPEPVDAPCNGSYKGRFQDIPMGSLAVVPECEALSHLEEFTVAAFVCPTTPGKGRQAIMGTWSENNKTGVGLEIGEDGALNLRLSAVSGGSIVISTGKQLRERLWYLVALSVSKDGITLFQECIAKHVVHGEKPVSVIAERITISHLAAGLFTFAAWSKGQTNAPSPWRDTQFTCHYNGKIDRPRILKGALTGDNLKSLMLAPLSEAGSEALVAAWDFSLNISEDTVVDAGPNKVNGFLINLPARAVTGHNWTGEDFHWRPAADQYGAIHFHDDDLVDACWDMDFEFVIPESLRSGIYAVRLFADQEEFWVPFLVTPPRRQANSKTALLLPTTTYLAYLNHRARFASLAGERLHGRLRVLDATDIHFIQTPKVGLSTYDVHSDGSGVIYASRHRPAGNFRPTGHLWNFSADLFIADWLENEGGDYDVISDEDLHKEGYRLLAPYQVVITGSHPEYASQNMLDALETFSNAGGRMMYLGGNGFYWRTCFHPRRDGVIEVRRSEGVRPWDTEPGENYSSFTGEKSGLWRKYGRPPQKLVGVGYRAQGFNRCSYYMRTRSSDDPRIDWAFSGIDSDKLGCDSVLLSGAAGIEIDAIDFRLGTPRHTLLIARSENHTNAYELASEEVLTPHGATNALLNADIHADMVFFETLGGGAVFSAGSIAYVGALAWNNFDNDLCRLTSNVLRRFLDDTPFSLPEDVQPINEK